MKEVINLLITKDIEGLCTKYGLKEFQAIVLCNEYNKLKMDEKKAMSMEIASSNQDKLMTEIVSNIISGTYLESEIENQMIRKYIAEKIEKSDDRISFLIEECGMNEEQIEEFLEKYNKVCQNKNELTMVANNFDSKDEVNKLLNELVSIYNSNDKKSVSM